MCKVIKHSNDEFQHVLKGQKIDPRISRIDKILSKFRPKFHNLYASIYGPLKCTVCIKD
jgi:hypothetical protein